MKKLREIFKGFATKSEHHQHHDCCGGTEHQHQHVEGNAHLNTTYQCPMKCEGDKTYDAPGRCPVCNMYLAPVGENHTHH